MTKPIQRSLLTAGLCLSLFSGQAGANERKLNFTDATRTEIRHSQIGMRNTLLFYTFADQKTVVRLLIDNKDSTFPVTGEILVFADSATDEGIKNWINNQHSCGLYPDVPEPILTQSLPAGQCSVTAHKALDKEKSPTSDDMFQNYEVTLAMKAYALKDKVSLTAFTDKSKVYVKQ